MTTENKHTPGPWLAHQDDEGTWAVLDSVRGFVTFAFPAECGLGGDTEANARIIAAAPDLLEALEWCVNSLEYDYRGSADDYEIPQSVRAEIAKARGQ